MRTTLKKLKKKPDDEQLKELAKLETENTLQWLRKVKEIIVVSVVSSSTQFKMRKLQNQT